MTTDNYLRMTTREKYTIACREYRVLAREHRFLASHDLNVKQSAQFSTFRARRHLDMIATHICRAARLSIHPEENRWLRMRNRER